MSCFALLLLAIPQPAPQGAPGRIIVLEKSAASVSILDSANGSTLSQFAVGDGPHEVAISPDGRFAVVSNYGGTEAGSSLSLISIHGQIPMDARTLPLGQAMRPHGLAFSADSQHLWVTAETLGELWRVNLSSGEVIDKVAVGMGYGHMVASVSESLVVVSHIGTGCITPVKRQANGTWKAMSQIITGEGAEGIFAQPNTDLVWVTNRAEDTVSIVDVELGEVITDLSCTGFPIRVMFPADGSLAAVSCPNASVVDIFDATTRVSIARIPIGLSAIDDADTRLFKDQFGDSAVPIGMTFGANGNHLYVSCAGADRVADLDLRLRRVVAVFATGKEPDGIGWYPAPLSSIKVADSNVTQ